MKALIFVITIITAGTFGYYSPRFFPHFWLFLDVIVGFSLGTLGRMIANTVEG